ncbi:hypothetical protein ACHHV8_11135 [Paenibacillus sp. TAB 01]|uniref:hypothetical protein n=1 Tax=Paenibacillus sp. TAB 01 TaxID=3368988 RepID=UPI003751450C
MLNIVSADWYYIYKMVLIKLKERGYRLEDWIESPEELQNETYVKFNYLLKTYDSSKSNINTWLSKTLPNKIVDTYVKKDSQKKPIVTVPIDQVENELMYEFEYEEELNCPWFKPDFDKMFFLTDKQRNLSDLYFNQGMSDIHISEILGQETFTVHRDLKLISNKIREYLSNNVYNFIYLTNQAIELSDLDFIENKRQKKILFMLLNGHRKSHVRKKLKITIDELEKELENAFELISEHWSFELEINSVLMDNDRDFINRVDFCME